MAKSLKEQIEERNRLMEAGVEERPVVSPDRAKALQDSFRKATNVPADDTEKKKSNFDQLKDFLRGKK